MKFPRKVFFVCLTVLILTVLLTTLYNQVKAHQLAFSSDSPTSPDWGLADVDLSTKNPVVTPPPPTEDTCLGCHILGQNKGMWTPLGRWILFGGLGLVFVFGVYRSASTWVTRAPWKSPTNRAADWVDDRYQISEPLSKILKKPVPRYALHWWYCLGGITAFLFVVQGITGILLAFYYKPTPEA